MLTILDNLINGADRFITDNPFISLVISVFALPLVLWLPRKTRQFYKFITGDRLTLLNEQLERVKGYRDGDKFLHLAGMLRAFITLTFSFVILELTIFYLSLVVITFIPERQPLGPFAYVMGVMLYVYLLQILRRQLGEAMHPERYISYLERQISLAEAKKQNHKG